MTQWWYPAVLIPAVFAAAVSMALPFIFGPFAVALTLVCLFTIALVVGVATLVGRVVVRSAAFQARPSQRRWMLAGWLGLSAFAVSVAMVLLAVFGSSTPALALPLGAGLGVTLLAYLAALVVVSLLPRSPRGIVWGLSL